MLTTSQLREATTDSIDELISKLESLNQRIKRKTVEYGPNRLEKIKNEIDKWIAMLEKGERGDRSDKGEKGEKDT